MSNGGRNRERRRIPVAAAAGPAAVECRPGCGSCCDPVVLPYALADAHRYEMTDAARRWVENDLEPMPQDEARAKAAYLYETEGPRAVLDPTTGLPRLFPHVYRCRHFDADTRLCGNWDDRPPTCRDFPRYGLDVTHPAANLPPDCEYRADQALPVIRRPERTTTP